ncbi:MAG: diacylglycerol/lipid kinase family protein, partial [Syntrophobacteria bacterium]
EDGPLHYTAVDSQPRYLLRALPALIRGRTNRYGTAKNGYVSHNVERVRLSLNSGFTLDGELFEAKTHLGPVVVQNGGKASFLRL